MESDFKSIVESLRDQFIYQNKSVYENAKQSITADFTHRNMSRSSGFVVDHIKNEISVKIKLGDFIIQKLENDYPHIPFSNFTDSVITVMESEIRKLESVVDLLLHQSGTRGDQGNIIRNRQLGELEEAKKYVRLKCSLIEAKGKKLDEKNVFKPKVFISYHTSNKQMAGKIKKFFDEKKIESFLAHEDIEVSQEWREVILKELSKSTIFIALLDQSFKDSNWCSQELGIAVHRKIKIVPLIIGEATVPYGFANIFQGKRIEKDEDLESTIRTFLSEPFPFLV